MPSWKNIKEFLARHKLLVLVIFLALLVRLVLLINLEPWQSLVWENKIMLGDAAGYDQLGQSLAVTGSFDSFSGVRTPVYPLFIALFYWLIGAQAWIVLLGQIILDAITVGLVYFLTDKIFNNKKAAGWAAFLYAIDLMAAVYTMRLYSESLFVVIFVLALYLLIKALKQNNIYFIFLSALVMGLATLIRPITFFLPILIIPFLFFIKQTLSRKFSLAAIFVLVFYLTIAPWQIYNSERYGHYALSSIQGINLLYYNAAQLKAQTDNISLKESREQLTSGIVTENPFDASAAYQQRAMSEILSHPVQYGFLHTKGIANLLLGTAKSDILEIFDQSSPSSNSILEEGFLSRIKRILESSRQEFYLTPILIAIQLAEYILAIVGVIWMFIRNKKRVLVVLLVAIIFYFLIVTGIVGSARFRLPIIPIYLIFSAGGLAFIIKNIKSRRFKPVKN